MAADGLTTTEIWARMMDEPNTPLTYSGLNTFLTQGAVRPRPGVGQKRSAS
ncbi:hypothetical protein ABTY61_22585 [Kitasatospora sp. NPDC096128]|uniref:hypothetical protein n=1 Tax=Kitasatospora sp. NPDC096128 TaxID=3155547 RepID=UPI0033246DF0